MKPSDSRKGAIRYRYYASVEDALAKTEHKGKPTRRIAAGDLETVVMQSLTDMLSDPIRIREGFGLAYCLENSIEVSETTGCFHTLLSEMTVSQIGQLSKQIDLQIMVGKCAVTATFSAFQFARRIGLRISQNKDRTTLFDSIKIERRSHRNRLGVEMGADFRPVKRDGGLVALILKAHIAKNQLIDCVQVQTPSYSDRHVARMARLAFLAPDITSSILDGTQPISLTARQLLRATEIPLAWAAQRRMFGYC